MSKSFLEHDGSEFIQAEVTTIDQDTNTVFYQPNERLGNPANTSNIFHQGKSEKLPKDMPIALTACEGPPVEMVFSLAHWLEKNHKGKPLLFFSLHLPK